MSKYAAGLEQQPAHRLIPSDPAEWRCDETGVTENLWLNLGTGHIGSGRQVRPSVWLCYQQKLQAMRLLIPCRMNPMCVICLRWCPVE